MFSLKNTTHIYSHLQTSLVHWEKYSKKITQDTPKPTFIFLTRPHCHWSQKLCLEAFLQPQIAKIINENFTAHIIDPHENPELAILMEQTLTLFLKGQNIRPGCIFLNTKGIPYFAGGYHPPAPRYGMPSFLQFLHHAIAQEKNEPNILNALARKNMSPPSPQTWCYSWEHKIDTAYQDAFDFLHLGFGLAPKYLHLHRLYTWREYPHRAQIVERVLTNICTTPMLDPISGCLYRMSEDALWELPVREALLHEQALFLEMLSTYTSFTPLISFLYAKLLSNFSLPSGLYCNSLATVSPSSFQKKDLPIAWKDDTPFFPEIPTKEHCLALDKMTSPQIDVRDERAILSSNAQLLNSLTQLAQKTSLITKEQVLLLETKMWDAFGWNRTQKIYHTTAQEMLATGSDIAQFLRALTVLQEWQPIPERAERIRLLLTYWEQNYIMDGICHTHPEQRFFQRGLELIGGQAPSAQEEAILSLSLLQKQGFKTLNSPQDVLIRQHWLIIKNPKLLSFAALAERNMVSPFAPVHGSSPAIVFHLHSPLSHRLLHHTANRAITRMVSTSAAKIYLENLDYKDVLFQKNTSWDLCSQDGQIHLGEIFNEDIEILLGPPSSSSVDSIKSIHRTKDGIINHRNHSITNPNKSVPLLQSPEYIFCMCTKDDSLFWIAGRKLYTPQSTHGHVLPPPLKDPVAMMLFKEEILIADRKGLWIFHRSQERFARYVGREGATVQDGLFPQAVFQNITTMSVYGIYIFVADAHNLRCINTQEGVVQTLNINIAPSYLSTIVVHKNNIFLSDFVQNKIWRYNLEHESAHQRRHDAPKDMMILDETMMILSGNSLTQHSIKGSWELVL